MLTLNPDMLTIGYHYYSRTWEHLGNDLLLNGNSLSDSR